MRLAPSLLLVALVACAAPTDRRERAETAAAPTARPPEQPAPRAAARGPALLVLHKAEATLGLYDPRDGTRLALAPTGVGPHEAAVSPDGRFAVVADYGAQVPGRTLTVYDLEQRRVARTVDLGEHRRPHGLAFVAEDELVVTCEASQALVRVDLAEAAVRSAIPTDQQVAHMLALDASGTRAYVANVVSGTLSAVDLGAGRVLAHVPTGPGAEGLAVSPRDGEVWVGNRAADTLTIVDPRSLSAVAELPCRGFPIRLAFTPDGARVLVSCAQAGEVAVFDVRERREVARVALLAPGEGAAGAQGPVPVGLLVEPAGERAFVAAAGADAVFVLDLRSLAFVARIPTGAQPDGMAWCAPGGSRDEG